MIYGNVKKICDEKGISISQLEKDAGLSNGSIGKWKNCMPQSDSLYAVAKVLKVKMETLLKESEEQ